MKLFVTNWCSYQSFNSIITVLKWLLRSEKNNVKLTLIRDTVDRGSNNCNSVAFGTSGKEFHFICYKCGKTGHKKSECRFRNKNKP